jgi:predicted dehydrogenase
MSDEEKVPKIHVSSAYPGEWHLMEIEGCKGALSLELRRPVGNEETDKFHLRFTTHTHRFDAESAKGDSPAHTHESVNKMVLTFSGPNTVWPDFVRCIQALASIFDTFSTEPLDRHKVRENFFRKKK